MSAGHVHALYHHGHSRLHRLRPQAKVLATILFVFAVVSTPREAFWAYGLYLGILVALAGVARLPARFILPRLLIEVPFLFLALLFPLLGGGERVDVLGISLSVGGLWAAWNIVAKATLGLLASIVMAGTTTVADILTGLDRLRLPRLITATMGFMIRYLDVVLGEFRRMRTAMLSRGYRPQWIWQAAAYANSAGLLFVRSYERGERVYLAMASRGYVGTMPRPAEERAPLQEWLLVLAVPAVAWVVAAAAWATA